MGRQIFLDAVKALPRDIPGERIMFGIRIEQPLLDAFKRQIKKDGVSMSDWLRGAISLYAQEQRAKK